MSNEELKTKKQKQRILKRWHVTIENATIVKYNAKFQNIIIPSRIGFKTIEAIGPNVFHKCGLKSVTISEGIKRIESYAFADNDLTEINIPNSTTFIGKSAFESNHLTTVNIPDSVLIIEPCAFFGNSITSIRIPVGIQKIEHNVFACNSLQKLDIPEGVTQIHDSAFAFNKLGEIHLPDTLSSIGPRAFMNNAIISMTIPPKVKRIPEYTFAYCKAARLIYSEGLKSIGEGAFMSTSASATLPNGLEEIGAFAFSHSEVRAVNLPDSVKHIGDRAFWHNGLKTNIIKLPANLLTIHNCAFLGNEINTEPELPPNAKLLIDERAEGYFMLRNERCSAYRRNHEEIRRVNKQWKSIILEYCEELTPHPHDVHSTILSRMIENPQFVEFDTLDHLVDYFLSIDKVKYNAGTADFFFLSNRSELTWFLYIHTFDNLASQYAQSFDFGIMVYKQLIDGSEKYCGIIENGRKYFDIFCYSMHKIYTSYCY